MDDVIARIVSSDHIRELTVGCNMASAVFIGPYLAFAATPEAGFKCLQAFVRLLHRVFLVMFSISLMYNAMVVMQSDRVPTGSALLINVMILATVAISAVRCHWWMSTIPKDATWANPHFTRNLASAHNSG